MGIGGWLLLGGLAAGIGVLMYLLYGDGSGAVPCCGCGQCIATGHCVMRRRKAAKKRKKSQECLDKSNQ